MSFVQRLDPETGDYIKIHVGTGEVVGRSPRPFPDADEVEPITRHREPARRDDPLGDFR